MSAAAAPGLLARLDASRALALGGITLLAVGMLVGEIYAIYISHVANALIKQGWAAALEAAGRGDMDAVREHFAAIRDLADKRGRIMNTHSHVGAFGLLALALALLQPALRWTGGRGRAVAAAFLAGAVLQVGGVYLGYYLGQGALYASDAGAVLLLGALACMVLALVRAREGPGAGLAAWLRAQLVDPVARLLLRAGVLLVLLGMAFGLYYAWVLVSADEPGMYGAIAAAMQALDAGDVAGAQSLAAQYKSLQSKIAITAAAHSHAIEFGLLMVLLGCLQGYVHLAGAWRRRWALALIAGGYALPVCVYLASRFGLVAAAFADLSGGLVLLGLLATMVGLIRYTGAADARAGAG